MKPAREYDASAVFPVLKRSGVRPRPSAVKVCQSAVFTVDAVARPRRP